MFRLKLNRFCRRTSFRSKMLITLMSLMLTFSFYRRIVGSLRQLAFRQWADPDVVYPVQFSKSKQFEDITLWSNDFHVSTVFDLKSMLVPHGVNYIDKSLSGSCVLFKSCPVLPATISQNEILSLNETIISRFYARYKDDPLMKRVSAFVCFHPASACELFMPFRKPIIVIASTRYELGRFEPERWHRWNENLKRIASVSYNVVAGNNRYDAEYIRYFTGIRATVLKSMCDYTSIKYEAGKLKKRPFLLASIHANQTFKSWFMNNFKETRDRLKSTVELNPIHKQYPEGYRYRNLVEHPGIVFVPYQVSIMSFFERYSMNIPMFFPSLNLLTEWHYRWRLVSERTWAGNRTCSSVINGVLNIPDPNDECNIDSVHFWLKYSDFYIFPHVVYFNSFSDLVDKLENVDLARISRNMKMENHDRRAQIEQQWTDILYKVRKAGTKR